MPEAFPPKPFNCTSETLDGTIYIRPEGELDLSTVPTVEECLHDARSRARRVVLDLRRLSFMDSTGLTLMTRWTNESRRDGFNFELIPGDGRVQRLFELTGMKEYFTFVSG